MKNLAIACITLISLMSFAQQNGGEKDDFQKGSHPKMHHLRPEQMAVLSTKKMTLRLDLNESQQKEINKLELERAKKKKEYYENRKNRKNLTDAERFELKNEMLDAQIAHQTKMKSILTEEQYQKWQSERHSKKVGRCRR
jgi:hypothetical protein